MQTYEKHMVSLSTTDIVPAVYDFTNYSVVTDSGENFY